MYRNIDTGNGKKEVTEASGSHVTDRIEILKLARTSNDDTWGRAVEERVEAARNFAHGRIVERARRGRGGRSATAYSSISKKYKPADMQMPGGSARCFACMDVRSCNSSALPWTRVARNVGSRAHLRNSISPNCETLRFSRISCNRDKYAQVDSP